MLNTSKSVQPSSNAAVKDSALLQIENNQVSRNVKKMIDYIDKNHKQDLSLEQIAEHVDLHPNYVSSLFKKETGITFIHYLHLYRIQKAKELMARHPELSFHDISEDVGYENVRHFFNVFKKYCGVTPGEFRSRAMD
jgi:two-component system response regulator YesN